MDLVCKKVLLIQESKKTTNELTHKYSTYVNNNSVNHFGIEKVSESLVLNPYGFHSYYPSKKMKLQ